MTEERVRGEGRRKKKKNREWGKKSRRKINKEKMHNIERYAEVTRMGKERRRKSKNSEDEE